MRRWLAFLVVLQLAGCAGPGQPQQQQETISVAAYLGAKPDPGFKRAIAPRRFSFPADHGAHPEYATEWWYFTGNLRTRTGREFGYQLTLFRVGLEAGQPADDSDWRAQQLYMGHLAISDIDSERHYSAERISRAAAGLAGANSSPLRIWLGSWSITGKGDKSWPLHLRADTHEMAIDLLLDEGSKPLVLQGEAGLSRKGAAPGNASYYYSYTRLPTTGTISLAGHEHVVEGDSWFDREWSSSALAADQEGWDWFALQLDDGRDLMFYRLRGRQGEAQPFSRGVLVGADGHVEQLSLENTIVEPLRTWTSKTGIAYPLEWRLQVAEHGIDVRVVAAFNAQEMRHTVHYWEGAVRVSGSHGGRGYLELSGYAR